VRILIVGAGAIGGLFAYFLIRSGQQVIMLESNPERVESIAKSGLQLEGISGEGTVQVEIVGRPARAGKVDLVMLCVKSYDTGDALRDTTPFLKHGATVLTVQNGLGNVEKIAHAVGVENTLGGITAHGATDLSAGKIRHAGKGETIIGALSETNRARVEEIARIFSQAGIETSVTDDVAGTVWSKVIINAAINPLTAILRLRNGELLNYPEAREIMKETVEETVAVAQAKNIHLKWPDPVAQTVRVCQATANNYSSMLQDILNRKRTEIDFINGAIVRESEALGIPAPVNNALTQLVKAIESIGMNKQETSCQ
jgi:2-dehydropantoate 2-reductase